MAGKRPPFKRAMLKLWRQGVRDDTDMRNAMQGLGFDMLDSKHHLRFRTLMSRLRKTDTTYLKGYPPPADIEEILARINVEDALAKVGFSVINNPDFSWIPFYKEFAGNLLDYRDDRESLLRALHEIVSLKDDKYADGSEGPLRDVCPFTTIGTFNRGITNKNRIKIASDIGKFLGVKESAPETFEGIPILNNKNSWLFPFERERGEGDIEAIWHFFAAALDFAESPDDSRKRQAFLKTYDIALKVKHVGQIYLTMGLYWIRPYDYLPLDKNSRRFVKEKFPNIGDVRKRGKDGDGYITLVEELKSEFQREGAPVTSFPQLSHEAYVSPKNPEDTPSPSPTPSPSFESYTWENIVKDGWFGGEKKLKDALKNLQKKKNLILQGPPGTGKTWLAKRLARVFITDQEGEKSKYLLPVQFHPNMSYEDFVMGWRPTGADGGVNLKLADGPMMEMINRAEKDVDAKYFIVIEEINRGNPAQIFGEMLTLMEADKREESE
ncbi:MAG: AAA family ATPase, partial [Alphaproteobacteria bacterium]